MTRLPGSRQPELRLLLERIAAWSGVEITPAMASRLAGYADWLIDEAIPAGGLGPGEADRVLDRHIGDALAFLGGLEGRPNSLVDLGSGVGLPGIPLAVVLPETDVTLVDRSGRRCRLMRRALAVLQIGNAEVVEADIGGIAAEFEVVTMRAVVPLETAPSVVRPLLAVGGCALVAGSRRGSVTTDVVGEAAGRLGLTTEIIRVPPDVLESGGWILRLRAL